MSKAKKPGKGTSRQKPTQRQKEYAEGRIKNPRKSKRKVAREAGYSEAIARNVAVIETSKGVQQLLLEAITAAGINDALIAQRMREGLDAGETKFFQHEGRVIETRDVISFGERRAMLDLILQTTGRKAAEKHEHTGSLEVLLTGTYE